MALLKAERKVINKPVSSLTALKALTLTDRADGVVVRLSGTPNGQYSYNSTSTATPNDLDVVKPDEITLPAPGRWLRIGIETSSDTELTANSDNLLSTQKAAKSYVTANQNNLYYFANGGNDTKDGKSLQEKRLTTNAAITAANAHIPTPNANNRVNILNNDGGLQSKFLLAGLPAGFVSLNTPTTGYNVLINQAEIIAGTLSIISLTRVGNTATAQTGSVHPYKTGMAIRILGADQTEYNGTFTITVTDTDKFTYTVTGSPVTPATGTISSSTNNGIQIGAGYTANLGWVKNDTASDTANVLFTCNPGGNTINLQMRQIFNSGIYDHTLIESYADKVFADIDEIRQATTRNALALYVANGEFHLKENKRIEGAIATLATGITHVETQYFNGDVSVEAGGSFYLKTDYWYGKIVNGGEGAAIDLDVREQVIPT